VSFSTRTGPYAACTPTDPLTPAGHAQCFLKIALGRGDYTAGTAACAQVGCAAVGNVVLSKLASKQYQIDTPNAYTGPGARPIPGPWNNPLDPAVVKEEQIDALTFVPAAANPAGYPVIVFQHGLARSRTDAVGIASQLAAQGYMVVAIDAVAHGARAIRISDAAARGCADPVNPFDNLQCFAPFLSPNLGAVRDNIRQTVIDQQRLVAALKRCTAAAPCGPIAADTTKLGYVSQSLGSIIGGVTTSIVTEIKASVLNVGAVGWVDVFENTGSLVISCSLVDGLIDAGILVGAKSNLAATPPTGLCTTPAWKTQPGYQQFAAIGRWVLDPADPANYTRRLAPRRFMIQEVVGDDIVPNVATMNQGLLLGRTAATADPATSATPAPSAAVTAAPTDRKWIRYPTLPAAPPFPGNKFGHGSLLSPADSTIASSLGLARMQVDAITFLGLNL
jgi:hypothetical protein